MCQSCVEECGRHVVRVYSRKRRDDAQITGQVFSPTHFTTGTNVRLELANTQSQTDRTLKKGSRKETRGSDQDSDGGQKLKDIPPHPPRPGEADREAPLRGYGRGFAAVDGVEQRASRRVGARSAVACGGRRAEHSSPRGERRRHG